MKWILFQIPDPGPLCGYYLGSLTDAVKVNSFEPSKFRICGIKYYMFTLNSIGEVGHGELDEGGQRVQTAPVIKCVSTE